MSMNTRYLSLMKSMNEIGWRHNLGRQAMEVLECCYITEAVRGVGWSPFWVRRVTGLHRDKTLRYWIPELCSRGYVELAGESRRKTPIYAISLRGEQVVKDRRKHYVDYESSYPARLIERGKSA